MSGRTTVFMALNLNQERSLYTLNEDVLTQIFELLRPNRGLHSLSATCKSLRRASLPVLFKRCLVTVRVPLVLGRFLPATLWTHCELLSLVDYCPDISSMRNDHHHLRYTHDRLLCGVMDGQLLKTTLHAMPRLRSIYVSFHCNEIHGLNWQTLTSILTAPSLENFNLHLFNFSPRPRLATDVDALSLAPLKSFQYIQPAFRRLRHYFPPERDALADVLRQLYSSLEALHLPSMSAPLNALSVEPWPRLHELVLQGQLPEGLHTPFITLLSGMPKLRVLRLMFALPDGVVRQPVWPRGLDTPFPWPELEELVLSFPTPDDQLYAYLPPCLRRLSLRCCPHHCAHQWVDRPQWHSPVLSASEMLQVLTQCQLPHLDHLQFEYRADNADGSLLRHLNAAFSRLLTLEVHRFRPVGVNEIPMVAIGEEIRSLSRLHTLSIHLDSPDYPTPVPQFRRIGGGELGLTYEQIVSSHRMLQSHANLLAPLLSRSVRLLRLVERKDSGGMWRPYRISREEDSGHFVRVQLADHACPDEALSPDWFVEIPMPN